MPFDHALQAEARVSGVLRPLEAYSMTLDT